MESLESPQKAAILAHPIKEGKGQYQNSDHGAEKTKLVHPFICMYDSDPWTCTRCRFVCTECRDLEHRCDIARKGIDPLDPFANPIEVRVEDSFRGLEQRSKAGCSTCRIWLKEICLSGCSRDVLITLHGERCLIVGTDRETLYMPKHYEDEDTLYKPEHYISGSFEKSPSFTNVKFDYWAETWRWTVGIVSGYYLKSREALPSDPHHPAIVAKVWEWLNGCCQSHTCGVGIGYSTGPTRLLAIDGDVARLQDFTTSQPAHYVALSYCWGGYKGLRLGAASTGRLRAGIGFTELPATIRDAAILVQRLGIPFLWCDALCLDQDEEEWQSEASRMNEIYGGAIFTLSVASANDAGEGFMKTRPGAAFDPEEDAAHFLGQTLGLRLPPLEDVRIRSPMARRGWILQEEIFSPRILFWSDYGIFWSCQVRKIAENGQYFEHSGLLSREAPFKPQDFLNNPACIDMWDDVVEDISAREFGCPPDRLPALEGLANIVRSSGGRDPGKYIAGTWGAHLPRALLWQITYSKMADVFRKPGDPPAPSWSWASIHPGRYIRMFRDQPASTALVDVQSFSPHGLELSGAIHPFAQGLRRVTMLEDEEGRPLLYDEHTRSNTAHIIRNLIRHGEGSFVVFGDRIMVWPKDVPAPRYGAPETLAHHEKEEYFVYFVLDHVSDIPENHLYCLEVMPNRILLLSDDVGEKARQDVKVVRRVGINSGSDIRTDASVAFLKDATLGTVCLI